MPTVSYNSTIITVDEKHVHTESFELDRSIKFGSRFAVSGGILGPDAESIESSSVQFFDRVTGDAVAHLCQSRVFAVVFLFHV